MMIGIWRQTHPQHAAKIWTSPYNIPVFRQKSTNPARAVELYIHQSCEARSRRPHVLRGFAHGRLLLGVTLPKSAYGRREDARVRHYRVPPIRFRSKYHASMHHRRCISTCETSPHPSTNYNCDYGRAMMKIYLCLAMLGTRSVWLRVHANCKCRAFIYS